MNNPGRIIAIAIAGVVIVAVILACIVVVIAFLLILLGPTIGNINSNIVLNI